mmetsp:Transcript_100017/g.265843  ORF Transcript_100017/g.265843 Transcript_100017/m.265843 type:complete len:117 (-) Transcript_100017:70-420(-)
MGDEVKLKLIFVNDPSAREMAVPASTVVRDVKKSIMENYWPTTIASIETVERVRLFAAGKELGGKDIEDLKSLKDVKLAGNPAGIPVHVQPVLRLAPADKAEDNKKASQQCLCTLL